MSIDLDWSLVDATLTQSATAFLANAFDAAPRPDFLGPLSVATFSFGDTEPQVELLDIRDVQKEFLAAEDGDEDELVVPRPGGGLAGQRTATMDAGGAMNGAGVPPSESPDELFPRRPFPFSPTGSVTGVLPTPQPPSAALFALGLHSHSIPSAAPTPFGPRSRSRSHSPAPPLRGNLFLPDPPSLGLAGAGLHTGGGHSRSHSQQTHPHSYAPPSPTPSHSSLPFQPPSSAPSPSFQLHLRVSYTGNLSLGISTSLLINYPSPGFMSLPLELTVTGLAFEGVLIVAFEGGRRRLHLSLVEAADSGPTITPGRRPSGTFSRPSGLGPNAAGMKPAASVGARILRSAQVESEVGQADKHVLKNVGKVERFVLEVARKTLENELVFPNFQSVLY